MANDFCSHLDTIQTVTPGSKGCEECLALGWEWFHLRVCRSCGYVGCCDKAKNRHSIRHYEATGHPIVRPHHERGMDWLWCRIDQALLEPRP